WAGLGHHWEGAAIISSAGASLKSNNLSPSSPCVRLCRWCLGSALPPGYGHGRTPQSLAQFRLAQVKTAAQRADPKSPLGSCVLNPFHLTAPLAKSSRLGCQRN